MQIRELAIKNFRCLKDVVLHLDDTTVIIGENNCGKSAVLDALRLVLTRRGSRRSGTLSEYDFHLSDENSHPKTCEPVEITVLFQELKPDDWPAELTQTLEPIIQTDPHSDIDSIRLRLVAMYSTDTKSYETNWQFLSLEGKELISRASASSNLGQFLQHVPIFYLSAMRDGIEEFSSTSQFWGRLLKSVDIPEDKRAEIESGIEELNTTLLNADPRLGQVKDTLTKLNSVVASGGASAVAIRALPLRIWDLLSKSEVILRRRAQDAWFPLGRHGQGVQSLAVIFLFHAFVEHLLSELYEANSTPILAMEEPEAHLHPQAARALWRHIESLPGQKLVTTHSPYFMQHVPFRKLRLLRRHGSHSKLFLLPASYSCLVSPNKSVLAFCNKYKDKYSIQIRSGELTVRGQVSEDEYRELLVCFASPDERRDIHPRIKTLRDESKSYISDGELDDLQEYVRRMRGEILFAKAWLLCEGQSEYILLHRFAEMMGKPLDVHGVSVIDYQNCGSPRAFVCLARAFGFPWFLTCDKDQGGSAHIKQVQDCGFSTDELALRLHQLPIGDFEVFLFQNGFAAELTAIAKTFDGKIGEKPKEEDVIAALQKDKPGTASELAARLSPGKAAKDRVPKFFQELIEKVLNAAE